MIVQVRASDSAILNKAQLPIYFIDPQQWTSLAGNE